MWISTEMYHHGIGGQHWGVRNGPPYPLGIGQRIKNGGKVVVKTAKNVYKSVKKAHDNHVEKKKAKREEKIRKLNEITKTKVPAYKKMTDEELRRAINRLRDEKTYRELTYNPTTLEKTTKFIKRVSEKPIENLATQIIDKKLTDFVNKTTGMKLTSLMDQKNKKKDNKKDDD